MDQRLGRLESDVSTLKSDMATVKTTLDEVLRRLPGPLS
jgi:hypothetical protein